MKERFRKNSAAPNTAPTSTAAQPRRPMRLTSANGTAAKTTGHQADAGNAAVSSRPPAAAASTAAHSGSNGRGRTGTTSSLTRVDQSEP